MQQALQICSILVAVTFPTHLGVKGDQIRLKSTAIKVEQDDGHPQIYHDPFRHRRNANTVLRPDGKNVCKFVETKTIYETVTTEVTETFENEVCCKEFIGCWKKCKRVGVLKKKVTKIVSKLSNLNSLHCCDGWSKNEDECTIPICNPYCRNNGRCVQPNICECTPGYTGRFCQLDINECEAGSNCTKGCINLPGTYQCSCPRGFTPKDDLSRECVDVDECSLPEKACRCASNKDCKAMCINTEGSYRCACGDGFRLSRANLCSDVNECIEDPNICPHKCVNIEEGYKCECFNGFKWNNESKECQPMQLCGMDNGQCGQICIPGTGFRLCACRDGYYLDADRRSCRDFNECNGITECDPESSTCVNTEASANSEGYYCLCKVGFELSRRNNRSCEDMDECKLKTHTCNTDVSKCVNTFGSYKCVCNEGYKMSSEGHCIDVDECEFKGTFCQQRCENTVGSFACACNAGYLLDVDKRSCQARLCEKLIAPFYGTSVCEGSSVGKKCTFACKNGFQLTGPSERQCLTSGKWSGEEAKCVPRDCPQPKPPANGRVTLPCELSFGATCPVSCNEGFILRGDDIIKCDILYGKLQWDISKSKCEEILVCSPNPCKNGGACSIVTDTEYQCNCSGTGYTGNVCDVLLVELSPIPKVQVNQVSPDVTIKTKTATYVRLIFHPDRDDIFFKSHNITVQNPEQSEKFYFQSKTEGIRWLSIDIETPEKVKKINDQMLFFYDTSKFIALDSLAPFTSDCYSLSVIPTRGTCSRPVQFRSSANWEARAGNLVTTDGLVFADISSAMLPVALTSIKVSEIFHGVLDMATMEIMSQPKAASCKESFLSSGQTQYALYNDIFAKEFITQFNKLTPSWFKLSHTRRLAHIHIDSIRSHLWHGSRVKSEPACSNAAIDEEGMFLVNLHSGKLTMEVNDKMVVMDSNGIFCLIVDLCKGEPHLALPPDNYDHLENVFSFTDMQSLGWSISAKAVGFTKASIQDSRQCLKTAQSAVIVAFGAATLKYAYKELVKSDVRGNMFVQVAEGQKQIAADGHCFDGRSQIDTPAWYTTDYIHKQYTKPLPAHSISRTSIHREALLKQDVMSLIQGEKSVFKMKTGLRQVLQKSSAMMNVDFKYKEGKSSGSGAGNDNFAKLSALETLSFPVSTLEYELGGLVITTSPLDTQVSNLVTDIAAWSLQLKDDTTELVMKLDDTPYITSKAQAHYYRTGPMITRIEDIYVALRAHADDAIDPKTLQEIGLGLSDIKTAQGMLKDAVDVKTAAKEFNYLTVSFQSNLCLFEPCLHGADVILYQSQYDLALAGMCSDITKGPYDMWQVDATISSSQMAGNFFNFEVGDKLYLCLSADGVSKAKIKAGIKLLGTEIRDTFFMKEQLAGQTKQRKIEISQRTMKILGKYDFLVNSTVNMELNNWKMFSIDSYGIAKPPSMIINKMQSTLDTYAVSEYNKLDSRINDGMKLLGQMTTEELNIQEEVKQNKEKEQNSTNELEKAKKEHQIRVQQFEQFKKDYDRQRQAIDDLEKAIKSNCTIQSCKFECIEIAKCVVEQQPINITKNIFNCKLSEEDRSYAYLTAVKSVCSHTVEDRRMKYTGNCRNPGISEEYAQRIIERVNKKIQNNESLTMEDAYDLELINAEKGTELREQIEKQLFFQNFPRRLTDGVLNEDEFRQLEKYTNASYAQTMRKKMVEIKNGQFLVEIYGKLNKSRPLTPEDYERLRQIDPEIEKEIKIGLELQEIKQRIKETGTISDEDLKKLEEIAPEYAKNLTKVMQLQEFNKQVLADVQRKIEKGTLTPDDIHKLESVNPELAEKLKKALKEQLEQKVKEIENKLNTVRGVIVKSFNNSELQALNEKLQALSGSATPIDEKALRNLQAKIQANNDTKGSVFEELLERLDLGFEILNLTGNSDDLKRVSQAYFDALGKFDVPLILQRSANSIMEGFLDVQGWFQTTGEVLKLACKKCSESCDNAKTIPALLTLLKNSIARFDKNVCQSTWTIGVKVSQIEDVCKELLVVHNYLNRYISLSSKECEQIKKNVVEPIISVVDTWKMVRTSVQKISQEQWKKSAKTKSMLEDYAKLTSALQAAISAQLGIKTMPFAPSSTIETNAANILKVEDAAVSLAQVEVLHQTLKAIADGIENIPNSGESKPDKIIISSADINAMHVAYSKLLNQIETSLVGLCEDKTPATHPAMQQVTLLITITAQSFSDLLASQTLVDFYTETQKVAAITNQVILLATEIKDSMLPCQLQVEKVESGDTGKSSSALDDLKYALFNTHVLAQKSISQLADDIKKLMGGFQTGATSPIGKLINLIEEFIRSSPEFNIPIMLFATPNLSTVMLNSFEEYFQSAKNFFEGLELILKKCLPECKIEEIFGKTNMIKITSDFDMYLKPLSKATGKLSKYINFTPKGLSLLYAGLEKTRTALQAMYKSDTRLNDEGLRLLLESLESTTSAVTDVKNGIDELYKNLAGTSNKNVQMLIEQVSKLRSHTEDLHGKSKDILKGLPELIGKLNVIEREISRETERKDMTTPSALARRLMLAQQGAQVLVGVCSLFSTAYTSNPGDELENYMDRTFAPAVRGSLDELKSNLADFLVETQKMATNIGIAVPELDSNKLLLVDVSNTVEDITKSAGDRKLRLAKELETATGEILAVINTFAQAADIAITNAIGSVSLYENQNERLKKQLARYGKMYDEAEQTIGELSTGSLSPVGAVKDEILGLVNLIGEYDVSMILSANLSVAQRKSQELRQLLRSTSEGLTSINSVFKNCKTCSMENILGKSFLTKIKGNLHQIFGSMFSKLSAYAEAAGATKEEFMETRVAAQSINDRFTRIAENDYGVETLSALSKALEASLNDIMQFEITAEKMGNILVHNDVDLQVISGTISNLISSLASPMNRSIAVATQADQGYKIAVQMKETLAKLKSDRGRLPEGPLTARLQLIHELGAKTKDLLTQLPGLFSIPEEELKESGVTNDWVKNLGGNIDTLNTAIVKMLTKTNKVLESAGVATEALNLAFIQASIVKDQFEALENTPWDQKMSKSQAIANEIGKLFESTATSAQAEGKSLDLILSSSDLKSPMETAVGKERLAKFHHISGNIAAMVTKLQGGPISNIGKLADLIDGFVVGLDKFDFKKSLLQNPQNLQGSFDEFSQLAQVTGDILKKASQITMCQTCDISKTFGLDLTSTITDKIVEKFSKISSDIKDITKRAGAGYKGLKEMVATAEGIGNHFSNIKTHNITSDTLQKISEGLLKSAVDIQAMKNGSATIFQALFNGDQDMTYLQENFEAFIDQIGEILNKSSTVVPNVGEIYMSLRDSKNIFSAIQSNLRDIQQGPIDARISVLREVTQGVNSLGRALPVLFNQSLDVLTSLGIDTAWFRRAGSKMVDLAHAISTVVNKTESVLSGAEIVYKDIVVIRNISGSLAEDYQKLLTAPYKQKFDIFINALGKADALVNDTEKLANSIDEAVKNITGININMASGLGNLTKDMSGFIGKIADGVKKVGVLYLDIASTIDDVKQGPVQKIGQLTDSTKEFVDSLKNYNLAEILVQAPRFAKEKIGDLKSIVSESGTILQNISLLVTKHCPTCELATVFGKDYIESITQGVTQGIENATANIENVLDKIEDGATSVAEIINSVKSIKNGVKDLSNLKIDAASLGKVSDFLKSTSVDLASIGSNSGNVFRFLFNDSADMRTLLGSYEGFITDMSAFLNKAGNYTGHIADAFGKLENLRNIFDNTAKEFGSLNKGPLEERVAAVKNIADGINSIVVGFPKIISELGTNLDVSFLRRFGTQMEGITGSISSILNKTSEIASGIGETIGDVKNIIDTAGIIKNDFKRLISGGSIGGKILIAQDIVSKVKHLTGQVDGIFDRATSVFETLTGNTLTKTSVFGNQTQLILDQISTGLGTIADRYEKFQELSKTISKAFDNIDDDPIKFALEDLPKLFDQTSSFIDLIFNDVRDVSKKLGIDIDGINIDNKLVSAAQQFMTFAKTTLGAIQSGKELVDNFKALVNSKSFKDALVNFQKFGTSAGNFITSIDQLGDMLFSNWDMVKGSFSQTIDSVSKSLGFNLQKIGGYLEKGLQAGGHILNIAASIEQLLSIKEFTPETVVLAANSVLQIANSGVQLMNTMGMNIQVPGLEAAGTYMAAITSVVQIYQGIKGFTAWLKDVCDITYETVVVQKNFTYLCYKEKLMTEYVKIKVEQCNLVPKTVVRGFEQAKLNCTERECVYLQKPDCLASNELCVKFRQDAARAVTSIRSETIHVWRNYDDARNAMNAFQYDIQIAEIKLSRAKLTHEKSKASLDRLQQQRKLSEQNVNVLYKQRKLIREMVNTVSKVSSVTIKSVEFQATSYQASLTRIPLRITVQDQFGDNSFVDITADFKEENASMTDIAHTIVRSFVDYISVTKRRRRNVELAQDNAIDKEPGAQHWATVCAIFQENFFVLRDVFIDLEITLKHTSDNGDSKLHSTRMQQPSTESAAVQALIDEISYYKTGTTENVADALKRWRDTSETKLSQDVGAVCTGFTDCLQAQFDNITNLLEAGMPDYKTALNAIDITQSLVRVLLETANLKKSSALDLASSINKAVTTLQKAIHFCDEAPRLVKPMPSSAAAYIGQTFELECLIRSSSQLDYEWRRNGSVLPSHTGFKLIIKQVSVEDGAYYTCEGKNLVGSSTSNKVLVRVFTNLQIITHPEDVELDFPGGASVTFFCNGTAEPEPLVTWWFKPYTSNTPIEMGQTSFLQIPRTSSLNIGHYWCTLSNGYHTVQSRKAKLDILRTHHKTEAVRLGLSVYTKEKQSACYLPRSEESSEMVTLIRAQLAAKIGLDSTNIALDYINKESGNWAANLLVNIGLQGQPKDNKDTIGLAFAVAKERVSLQSKVDNLMRDNNNPGSLDMPWKSCTLTLTAVHFAVNWQVGDMACPRGMGSSKDGVKCTQCSPGTYDNLEGVCVRCPVGMYQPAPGQTRCIPCGPGLLTASDGTPDQYQCQRTEFLCNNRINLAIAMDSNANVRAENWPQIKQLVASLLSHMQLGIDRVTISIINFGDAATLEISSQSYNSKEDILSLVDKLPFISGTQRLDLALELGKRILDPTQREKSTRNVLLFITSQVHTNGSIAESNLKERAATMRDQGTEIFMVVAGSTPSRHHLEMSSKPLAKYLLLASDANDLTKMGTVTARAVCHNVL